MPRRRGALGPRRGFRTAEAGELELNQYWEIIRRRIVIIGIATGAAVLIVVAQAMLAQPTYTARATARVLLDVGATEVSVRDDYGKRLLNTYGQLLRSGPYLEEAISRVAPGSSLRVESLRERVDCQVVPDTELITVTVQDSDPARASDLANALVALLVENSQRGRVGSGLSASQIYAQQLSTLDGQLASDRQQLAGALASGSAATEVDVLKNRIGIQENTRSRLLERYNVALLTETLLGKSIVLAEPAARPRSPANGFDPRRLALGLVVGVLGGVVLALVLDNVDTRLISPSQLADAIDVPILGVVPRGLLAIDHPRQDADTAVVNPLHEAFWLVNVGLQSHLRQGQLRKLMITSPTELESRADVTYNLAMVFAEHGRTTQLVDADLRSAGAGRLLGLSDEPGLSGLLSEDGQLNNIRREAAIHTTPQRNLYVIGSGARIDNPAAALASPAGLELLDYLVDKGRLVLLDCPPVLGSADAAVLSLIADGVIVVVQESVTRRDTLAAALSQLEAGNAHVLGIVYVKQSRKRWSVL